jgi:hypothetical protein
MCLIKNGWINKRRSMRTNEKRIIVHKINDYVQEYRKQRNHNMNKCIYNKKKEKI